MDGVSAAMQWLQHLLFGSSQGAQLLSVMVADAGLGGPPSLETIIILSTGLFLGSIAMGICGFGTAIIHLCVWGIAGALGYDAGPLKLAVIACSCCLTISMVPFFFLANATKHAVRPLAISIPLCKAIAAPLGAVVLKLLPARQLEAVVAALMLSLMLLLNRQQLLAWCQGLKQWWLGSSCRHDGGACGWQCKECTEADVRSEDSSSELRLALLADEGAEYIFNDGDFSDGSLLGFLSSDDSADDALPSGGGADGAEGHMRHPSHKQQHCTDGAVLIQDQDLDTEDCRPLLDSDVTGSTYHSAADRNNRQLQMEALAEDALVLQLGDADDEDAGSSQSQSDQEDEVHGEAAMLKHSFWGLFAIGAVAGLATGLLGGATGISGPPMMLMYAYLNASKSAVRGTNAVMAMVQDQLIGYYMFGMLRWSDRWLYAAAAGCGAAGLIVGHSLQKAAAGPYAARRRWVSSIRGLL
ncbi:hypothetical protein OEZ86_005261 [Tetradesmus obliquus]|nr:hypothetical protein OEZ86_005261 [Tetradesmus obliquus]